MLSIIIPLAPKEQVWQNLAQQIYEHYNSLLAKKLISQDESLYEILLCSKKNPYQCQNCNLSNKSYIWVAINDYSIFVNRRAFSLNSGAKFAKYRFLWFLHADSLVSQEALLALITTLRTKKDNEKFYYFKLDFSREKEVFLFNQLMKLNAFGANLRSKILKAPFGDQGFCLSQKLFNYLGAYPLQCSYGEDHLLTLKAKAKDIAFQQIPAILSTSPRKYFNNGWLKTTLLHQYLYWKQIINYD